MGKAFLKYSITALAAIAAAVILTYYLGIVKIQGNGMSPQLEKGQIVFINKKAFTNRSPHVGDLIVIRSYVHTEEQEGGKLVRKVAACDGDIVEIKNGAFYVNGAVKERDRQAFSQDYDKIVVGEDHVFVLGTNDKSLDSRDQAIGEVADDEIIGKVIFHE